jgi:hypothetical protein
MFRPSVSCTDDLVGGGSVCERPCFLSVVLFDEAVDCLLQADHGMERTPYFGLRRVSLAKNPPRVINHELGRCHAQTRSANRAFGYHGDFGTRIMMQKTEKYTIMKFFESLSGR